MPLLGARKRMYRIYKNAKRLITSLDKIFSAMTQELFRAMIQGLGEGPYLPPTLSCHSTCVDVTLDSFHWLPRTFYPVKMLCREKQQGRHPLSGPGPRPSSEGQTRISQFCGETAMSLAGRAGDARASRPRLRPWWTRAATAGKRLPSLSLVCGSRHNRG